MKKMIALVLFVLFIMPVAAPQVFAAEKTESAGIVDVGNKMCPVMGGSVSGKDFVVYEGKQYGLCCPGCEKTFLSDPARYIAQMETKESATVTPAESDASASEEMQRDMEQGDL